MWVARLEPVSFRNLEDRPIDLDPGLNVLHGPNGAGKTNVLEAVFFALTGRSPRTRREREAISFGAPMARVGVRIEPGLGESVEPLDFMASVSSGEARRRLVNGALARPDDDLRRPATSLFMPDRLALVKGPPAPRRAHLDRFAAALQPAKADLRSAYAAALGQRNGLLARLRRGQADPTALDPWDRALAEAAIPLTQLRAAAAEELRSPFTAVATRLGLADDGEIAYRPRIGDLDRDGLVEELRARRGAEIALGHGGFGPHRDEIEISFAGRSLRRYGSQGQQRLGVLALLFAERDVLRGFRRRQPLMLLDDVMSELDPDRRNRLVEMLESGGQSVLTATDRSHVPVEGARMLAVSGGSVGGGDDGRPA